MLAILYVEVAQGSRSDEEIVEKLSSLSLLSCKQLVYKIGPNEIIIRLEGDELEYVNRAINQDFAAIEGVKQITTCIVKKS